MGAFKESRKRYLLVAASMSILFFCLILACKKDADNGPPELTVRDKLLGTWRRNLRGYDLNGNHFIDSSEVNNSPSAKATDTIILTLVPDATYVRSQIFKGAAYPENGTWHLQQSDKDLVLQPSTSTSRVDTFRLDTVSQVYFLQHRVDSTGFSYYESFIRPN